MDNTTSTRRVSSSGSASKRPGTHDFSAAHVSADGVGRDLDPVIGIDHFRMRGPKFPPHPHAGFSAVTYLFEDSEGEFRNHDSLGHELLAKPGSIIWTVAGSGVIHEELPNVKGELAHGLQIFVNLAAAEKLQAPRVLFTNGPDVPVYERDGARVRVVVGLSGGVSSKIMPPGEITLLEVRLGPGAVFEQPFSSEHSVLGYVISGVALAGDQGRRLGALDAASFAPSEGGVRLQAGDEGAQVVLLAGRPLRERVVSYGPFIMNDEQQIEVAVERFRAGRMGSLTSAAKE